MRQSLRPYLSRPLVRAGALLVPGFYRLYMALVWSTSRVVDHGVHRLHDIGAEHDGAVGLLWHEEVSTVAYAYHRLGFRPHTLASVSDFGEVVTRVLESCGFVVFRGGSSGKASRRRSSVTSEMIDHMRKHRGVIYGITVDGSRGPRYRLKPGGIVIARDCGKPIVLVRTWYARCLRLRTWDHSALPLPFNRISHRMRGPYFVPEAARDREGFEDFRRHLERELAELAAESYDEMGQPRPATLAARLE